MKSEFRILYCLSTVLIPLISDFELGQEIVSLVNQWAGDNS